MTRQIHARRQMEWTTQAGVRGYKLVITSIKLIWGEGVVGWALPEPFTPLYPTISETPPPSTPKFQKPPTPSTPKCQNPFFKKTNIRPILSTPTPSTQTPPSTPTFSKHPSTQTKCNPPPPLPQTLKKKHPHAKHCQNPPPPLPRNFRNPHPPLPRNFQPPLYPNISETPG
jgi:hypothetical protein